MRNLFLAAPVILGLFGCTVDGQITSFSDERAIKQTEGENRLKVSPGSARMAGLATGARLTVTPNLKRSVGVQAGAVLTTNQNKLSGHE